MMRGETFSADTRREKILELLNTSGKVKVSELALLFGISEVSIRNDLIELEKKGDLERTHGGAVSTVRTYYNMDFFERKNKNVEEKRNIAAKVASLISDGDTVMLNAGTTSFFIANELKAFRKLKIITNSIAVVMDLANSSGINVTLLGGKFNPAYHFSYGDDAATQLRRYNTDVSILSIDGVAALHGLTTYHEEEAEICRMMLARAKRRIIAADFSKIGRESFTAVAGIEEVDILVTNENASKDECALLEELNPQIIIHKV